MMNGVLTCSSGGWLMITTSVVFYSVVGLAIFSLIKGLFSGSRSTVPTTTDTSN